MADEGDPIEGRAPGSAPKKKKPRGPWASIRKRWRPWLRAIHRDVGYLAVGLTVIYAASGLAINHIGEWDPNFASESREHRIAAPIPTASDQAATDHVLAALSIEATPADFFFEDERTLEIYFNEDERRLVVDVATGRVAETFKSERFFLRVANWLHYNRGKAAWTYIADGYALFLLFLAGSGLFMLKGKKGLRGRGAILVALGAAVPLLYIHLSGGP
jgi:hypothetical protein